MIRGRKIKIKIPIIYAMNPTNRLCEYSFIETWIGSPFFSSWGLPRIPEGLNSNVMMRTT
jgi:hypothetical protein